MVGSYTFRVYHSLLNPSALISSAFETIECFKMDSCLCFSPTTALARSANDGSVGGAKSAVDDSSLGPKPTEPGSNNSCYSGSGSVTANAGSPAAQSAIDTHIQPSSDQSSPAHEHCHHSASSHNADIFHSFDKFTAGSLKIQEHVCCC